MHQFWEDVVVIYHDIYFSFLQIKSIEDPSPSVLPAGFGAVLRGGCSRATSVFSKNNNQSRFYNMNTQRRACTSASAHDISPHRLRSAEEPVSRPRPVRCAATGQRSSCDGRLRSSGRRPSCGGAGRSGNGSAGPTRLSCRRRLQPDSRSWLQSHHNAAGGLYAQSDEKTEMLSVQQ